MPKFEVRARVVQTDEATLTVVAKNVMDAERQIREGNPAGVTRSVMTIEEVPKPVAQEYIVVTTKTYNSVARYSVMALDSHEADDEVYMGKGHLISETEPEFDGDSESEKIYLASECVHLFGKYENGSWEESRTCSRCGKERKD